MDTRLIYCEACKDTQTFGKFHNKCGARLGGIPHCPACNSDLWPHERFCGECGVANPNTNMAEVAHD
jgi:hypothetical protein